MSIRPACRDILVLVVEDEAIIRMLAAEVLMDAGFQVEEASHAEEALAILRSRPQEFRGLFTDVHMPGPIDGVALVHEAARCWPWLGLLVASGRFMPAGRELPHRCRFLPKPYELDHLIRNVHEMTAAASGLPPPLRRPPQP